MIKTKSFWESPFDEAYFNGCYCRAMLMVLVISFSVTGASNPIMYQNLHA
jgi:hypothetical protein